MHGPSRVDERAPDSLAAVLDRTLDQRVREYKYRCAQAIVFGLPVVALQYFGSSLGGPEATRWVVILQSLLAGWVIYVGAAGMLFEGIIHLRRRISGDLVVSLVTMGLYLVSLFAMIRILIPGTSEAGPVFFHVCVIMIAAWSAIQWARWGLRLRSLMMASHQP